MSSANSVGLVRLSYTQGVIRQEHKISGWIYRMSHKPHHRFLSPKMFDAFNGSVTDTIFMILVPLFITAQVAFHAIRRLNATCAIHAPAQSSSNIPLLAQTVAGRVF